MTRPATTRTLARLPSVSTHSHSRSASPSDVTSVTVRSSSRRSRATVSGCGGSPKRAELSAFSAFVASRSNGNGRSPRRLRSIQPRWRSRPRAMCHVSKPTGQPSAAARDRHATGESSVTRANTRAPASAMPAARAALRRLRGAVAAASSSGVFTFVSERKSGSSARRSASGISRTRTSGKNEMTRIFPAPRARSIGPRQAFVYSAWSVSYSPPTFGTTASAPSDRCTTSRQTSARRNGMSHAATSTRSWVAAPTPVAIPPSAPPSGKRSGTTRSPSSAKRGSFATMRTSSATSRSTSMTRAMIGLPSSSIQALSCPMRRLLPPAMIAAEITGATLRDARGDERGDAVGIVEREVLGVRRRWEVADDGDELRVVAADELARERRARDLDLRQRRALEALDDEHVKVVAGVTRDHVVDARLRVTVVNDRHLTAARDDRLQDAGAPDAVAVLAGLVDLEALVRVLQIADAQPAADDERKHGREERRLAAVVSADERDGRSAQLCFGWSEVVVVAGLSPVDSSRKVFTPRPSWPSTSGSLPAPNTMSTSTRTKTSSPPPRLNGIGHFPWRRAPRFRPVYSRGPLFEEAAQKADEQGHHDDEHERRQVTADEDEHQLGVDRRRGSDRRGTLAAAEVVACVAHDGSRAPPQVARAIELVGERGQLREIGCARAGREGPEQRRAEVRGVARFAEHRVQRDGAGPLAGDRGEGPFRRSADAHERIGPLDRDAERALRVPAFAAAVAVARERWGDQGRVTERRREEREACHGRESHHRGCRRGARDDVVTHRAPERVPAVRRAPVRGDGDALEPRDDGRWPRGPGATGRDREPGQERAKLDHAMSRTARRANIIPISSSAAAAGMSRCMPSGERSVSATSGTVAAR